MAGWRDETWNLQRPRLAIYNHTDHTLASRNKITDINLVMEREKMLHNTSTGPLTALFCANLLSRLRSLERKIKEKISPISNYLRATIAREQTIFCFNLAYAKRMTISTYPKALFVCLFVCFGSTKRQHRGIVFFINGMLAYC